MTLSLLMAGLLSFFLRKCWNVIKRIINKMKKAQSSTEYLIILAVVVIIALIVAAVMGGIPGIGGAKYQYQIFFNSSDIDELYSNISLKLDLCKSHFKSANNIDFVYSKLYYNSSSKAFDLVCVAHKNKWPLNYAFELS